MVIHSFRPFLLRPFKSSTTQRRSRLQHGYRIGVSRRSAHSTAGKGLAQGPYVAATARVEQTTLRLKVIVSTKAPPRPTQTCSTPVRPSSHIDDYTQTLNRSLLPIKHFTQQFQVPIKVCAR